MELDSKLARMTPLSTLVPVDVSTTTKSGGEM
jgi:hypothetical protein